MSIIANIYKDFVTSGKISGAHEEYSDEMAYLFVLKVIRSIANFFGMDGNSITILYDKDPLEIVPTSDPTKLRLEIPVLAVLNPTTVPKEMAFDGPGDPKLNELSHVQSFTDFVADKFHSTRRKKVTRLDAHALRLFLEGMKDMELAKKSFIFSIGHELGHLYYKHGVVKSPHSLLFTICTLGIYKIYQMIKERNEEMEADAFSFQKSKELAEGGIYLFTVLDKDYVMPKAEKVISLLFKIGLTITHHSSKTRKSAIESYWNDCASK